MELEKDLLKIAEYVKENKFQNCKIMVTGATGLLGSLLVKGFLEANKVFGSNNKVFALARNEEKAKVVFEGYSNYDNFNIIKNEITEEIIIDSDIDYIFHTACVTSSKEMVTYPVELVKTSVNGTINVLDFAIKHHAKSVVYLSSMEVFGVCEESDGRLSENDLGKLDLTAVRSCYPESKRLCENLCKCYSEEFGLNVCVARLTQTFGAGASLEDKRIFAMLARCAISGDDIIFKTAGKLVRDYCYTTDALKAVLLLSQKGNKGEVYNIANEETTISAIEMARFVAEELGNGTKVVVKQGDEAKQFSPQTATRLDTTKMRNLGWKPQVGLKEMYAKLIQSYKELMKK